MPTSDDLQFKDLVLQNRLVTPEQIQESLNTLSNYETAGIIKPLSSILMEKGLMTLKQVNAILNLQGKSDQYVIRGYTVLSELGHGGLGIVYKARQDSVGRIVALKIMYANMADNPQYLQRFMREGKVCASLDHPNIVKGIDFGESDGIYFFAMEFIDGPSLKDFIEKKGILSEKEAADIILQIAKGLKYAEERNLVHRDIKPENILLTRDGIPKLCDLGLAKTLESDMSVTQTGVVVGTPNYISPEAAMGIKDMDIRADIYSLGVTFYYMVTGDLPYHGDSAIHIIGQHITGTVRSARETNPKLSESIDYIISTMMAKKRTDRYQTVQELIVDLMRFLRGEKPIFQPHQVPNQKDDANKSATKTTAVSKKIAKQEMLSSSIEATITTALSSKDVKDSLPSEKVVNRPDPPLQVSHSGTIEESQRLVQHLEKKVQQDSVRKKSKWRWVAMLLLIIGIASIIPLRRLLFEKLDSKDSIVSRFVSQIKPPVVKPYKPKPLAPYQIGQALLDFREKCKKEADTMPLLVCSPEEKIKNMVRVSGDASKNIKDYYIDKYEVTNEEYAEFCKATNHPSPEQWPGQGKRSQTFLKSSVVNVSLFDAQLFARWAGKRLPSEAEWDYANRQGLLQNKANVWEWTCTYYEKNEMDYIIRLRGNSSNDGFFPNNRREYLGFRCCMDIPE